jgi:hypothetical protein
MLNHNNFSPESVVHNSELPAWVILFFKLYAGVFLGLLSIFTAKLIYFYTFELRDFLTSITFEGSHIYQGDIEVSSIIPAVFLLIVFALGILNAVAVFKTKRWALPLTLLSSFFIILLGSIALFSDGLEKPLHSVLVFMGIVMLLLVFYSGIKYWKFFTAPTRRLSNQIPSFILLLPVIVFASATFIFTDDPEIHDSDLLLSEITALEQSENAHYFLPVIKELKPDQRSDFEVALEFARADEGGVSGSPEAILAVEKVSNLVDDFVTASDKKGYQCPTVVNDYNFDAKLCSLNDIRNLAVLTSLRADIEAAAGNYDQAIKTAVSIVRMGALVGNSEQPVIIERLVGMALSRIGLETIQKIIDLPEFSIGNSQNEVMAELDRYKFNNSSSVASMKREYLTLKNSYAPLEQYASYFYQHNKTVNDLAEVFRRQIEVLGSSCGPEHLKKSEDLENYIRRNQAIYPVPAAPNYIGEIVNMVIIASLNNIKDSDCEISELRETVHDALRNS